MEYKLPERDPIGAYQREAVAARRFPAGSKCTQCGESRPEALIPGSEPIICAACKRLKEGKSIMDAHHPAGENNNPTTISVFVNDHRAELNVMQYDWPKATRENRDGSPLLAAAGCVRGFCDTLIYLVKKLLLWIPELLEKLDLFLSTALGAKYWLNTELAAIMPKQ